MQEQAALHDLHARNTTLLEMKMGAVTGLQNLALHLADLQVSVVV